MKSSGLDKKTYMEVARKYLGCHISKEAHFVFKKDDIIFVVPGGTKEIFPAPNEYFNKQELIWLDNTLKKYKDKKVVIIQHYPLLLSKVQSHNLWKEEDYFEVIKKYNNIIVVVSGHYHENREEKIGNIYHIISPALRNGNYKIIKIDKNDYSVFTSLIEGEE